MSIISDCVCVFIILIIIIIERVNQIAMREGSLFAIMIMQMQVQICISTQNTCQLARITPNYTKSSDPWQLFAGHLSKLAPVSSNWPEFHTTHNQRSQTTNPNLMTMQSKCPLAANDRSEPGGGARCNCLASANTPTTTARLLEVIRVAPMIILMANLFDQQITRMRPRDNRKYELATQDRANNC